MDSPSASVCIGCPVNNMAEHVCVCIPTNTTCCQSTQTHAEIQLHSDSDCSVVAETASLPTVAQIVNSKPSSTATQTRSIDSVQGTGDPPRSGVFTSDCMAIIDRRLSTKGFSQNTRSLLAKSWRIGTQRDYRSKFKQFSSWCSEREIDPYIASLADCADFLTSLFGKGLKYRTINGYRSMLSTVLAPVENVPVGQHPFIIRLLREVFNERPPCKSLVPEWDLLLVLECLKRDPFEPLKVASLQHLTWKTCFLLAITTFRRCSDLQSLQLGEGFVNVQKKGITFIRPGLSKQSRPSHIDRNIFVPALPENKLLDPKRALYCYLKRTEEFRKDKDQEVLKLFLSTRKPHKSVSTQTISRWIVDVVKFCYMSQKKSVKNVKGHSTRSVGPSWALFKGATLQQIMDSADWSRETTFTRHYLKSINVDFMNE